MIRKLTPLQEVMKKYSEMKGITDKEKVQVMFRTFCRYGKDLLILCDGSSVLGCECIESIGLRLEEQGLNWSMSAVVKGCPDWLAVREKKEKEERERKEMRERAERTLNSMEGI